MTKKRSKVELQRARDARAMRHLNILSRRDAMAARAAFAEEFGMEIDVQAVAEAFDQKVVDAICASDGSVEIPVELAEAVTVLLKSVPQPPSHRGAPRKAWRDAIGQRAAIEEARVLKAELIEQGLPPREAESRAAHQIEGKFRARFKKFSTGTIKDRMKRKPRGR